MRFLTGNDTEELLSERCLAAFTVESGCKLPAHPILVKLSSIQFMQAVASTSCLVSAKIITAAKRLQDPSNCFFLLSSLSFSVFLFYLCLVSCPFTEYQPIELCMPFPSFCLSFQQRLISKSVCLCKLLHVLFNRIVTGSTAAEWWKQYFGDLD
jgi:hypothetical protein